VTGEAEKTAMVATNAPSTITHSPVHALDRIESSLSGGWLAAAARQGRGAVDARAEGERTKGNGG
jgi:hypothetical protein